MHRSFPLFLIAIFFSLFFGCASEEENIDSPVVGKLRTLLTNALDSTGNFQSYWTLLQTDVDTTINPPQLIFKKPEIGKRTLVAFTHDKIIAVNEYIDSSIVRSSHPSSPMIGFDSYALDADSMIIFKAVTSPDRVKILAVDENDLVILIPGDTMPMKYERVRMSAVPRKSFK